jgi:hypothetical protein
MNGKVIGLTALLAAFAGAETYAVWQVGYVGLFEQALGSVGAALGFADLCVALGLVTIWLVQDARDRGISPIPYMVLTLALGSVGPLLYLVRREASAPEALGAALGAH